MIDIKILAKAKTGQGNSTASRGITTTSGTSGDVKHATKADIATIAKNLDPSSTDWATIKNIAEQYGLSEEKFQEYLDQYGGERFLSKVTEDVAAGRITFEQGLTSVLEAVFGDYARGQEGNTGAKITPDGTGDFVDLIVKGIVRGDLSVEQTLNALNMVFSGYLKSVGAQEGTDGHGIIMDAAGGHIQTDGLDVLGYMRVMELIINRLQLMESDYSFTDGATTERIVNNGDGTLTIYMRKEHENDLQPFEAGDVLYGKVNDLLSHGTYYTTWLRVNSISRDNPDPELGDVNCINVTLYAGNDVEGGKNFTPNGTEVKSGWTSVEPTEYDKAVNLTRWGNANTLDDTKDGRRNSWHLSTTDKRIYFLRNVTAPKLADDNWGLVLGYQPTLSSIFPTTLDYSIPYLYAGGLIIDHSHIHNVNYPEPTEYSVEDCGEWEEYEKDPATGRDKVDPETGEEIRKTYIRGTRTLANGVIEKIAQQVRHNGRVWLCTVASTTQEPTAGCTDWVCTSTFATYSAEVEILNAYNDMLTGNNTDVTLEMRVKYGEADVTDEISNATYTWKRYTGYDTEHAEYTETEADRTWNTAHGATASNRITLTAADMGTGWMEDYGSLLMGCTVRFEHEGGFETLSAGCVVQGVPEGPAGENALHVEVQGPNIIKNGQGSVTLEAFAFDGETDVTETLRSAAFSWERESLQGDYSESDEAWNSIHRGYGRTLTVDQSEILVRSFFSCTVDYSKTK